MLFKARLAGRLVNLGLRAANPRIPSHSTLCLFILFRAGDKMASVTQGKARKINLSVSEIAILTDKVEENLSVLQRKLTNSVTNQKKNAVGVEMRTVHEVREKWKILHSAAKKEYAENWRLETKSPRPSMPLFDM